MRHLYKLAVLSIFAFAGCAVEAVDSTDPAGAPESAAVSVVEDPDPGLSSTTQAINVECFAEWICQPCPGVNRRRDRLIETCDDGTTRVVDQTECGQRDCN